MTVRIGIARTSGRSERPAGIGRLVGPLVVGAAVKGGASRTFVVGYARFEERDLLALQARGLVARITVIGYVRIDAPPALIEAVVDRVIAIGVKRLPRHG